MSIATPSPTTPVQATVPSASSSSLSDGVNPCSVVTLTFRRRDAHLNVLAAACVIAVGRGHLVGSGCRHTLGGLAVLLHPVCAYVTLERPSDVCVLLLTFDYLLTCTLMVSRKFGRSRNSKPYDFQTELTRFARLGDISNMELVKVGLDAAVRWLEGLAESSSHFYSDR